MTIEYIERTIGRTNPKTITIYEASLVLGVHENTIYYRIGKHIMPRPSGEIYDRRRCWSVDEFLKWCNASKNNQRVRKVLQ